MGMMVNGEWRAERRLPSEAAGATFERIPTTFRDWVDSTGPHPPEAGRYHLYIARPCPWAHRTTIVRALKGLEEAISIDILDPIRINAGWRFSPDEPGCTSDSLYGERYLSAHYRRADPDFTGKVSVPVLWDRHEETIVNNESKDIIRMLDQAFDPFATRDVELFPEHLPVMDRIEEIYEPINNGVYRAGFARRQDAYDEAVSELFAALTDWNGVLAEQRYMCGEQLTAADICLFTTMYRFDEVYHTHFKCNQRKLTEFEHLWAHTREIYQLPGVHETCNMDHCKRHYYQTHTDTNPSQVVPIGPNPDFSAPHGREQIPGGPPADLSA